MNSILLFLSFSCSTIILFRCQSANRVMGYDSRIYTAVSMTFLLMGIMSLVAVRLSHFSLLFVAAMMLPISILSALLQRFTEDQRGEKITEGRSSSLLIVFFGANLCIIFYAFFPTYFLQGGRDQGVYLLFSHYINRTGGLNLDLPWLREAYETYGNSIRLSYGGIYNALQRGLSDDPTKLIPQFMHLFPAYGAIGAGLAGIEGIVRTNAVIVFFALWSFFMVAREFMETWAAALATLLLLLNPALLWTGRATFTEPLHIFIFFFGLHFLHNAVKFKSAYQGGIAGLVLGLAVLNRLSGGLNIIVVAGGVLYILLIQPEHRRTGWALVTGYFLTATAGFIDGYIHSFPYFTDLWAKGGLRLIVFSNYGVTATCMLLLWFRFSDQARINILSVLDKTILPALFLLVSWLFIRYQLGGIEQKSFFIRAVRELSWYVTGEVMILALLSLLFAKKNNDWCYLFLICICLGTTLFIYTWKPSIHPDHYWASRRWVVFCIPLILFAFGRTMSGMFKMFMDSGFSAASAIFIIGIPVVWYLAKAFILASPFLFISLLHSYPEGYAKAAESIKSFDSSGVYLTRDMQAASYLTYMYDIPTVMITDIGVERIGQGTLAHQPALGLDHGMSDVADRYKFCGRYTERVIGRRPVDLIQECRDLTPGFTIDPKGCQNVTFRSVSSHINTHVGKKDLNAGTLISNGTAGTLQFGPYIAAGRGKYRVLWRGKILQTQGVSPGTVDVVADKGEQMIKSRELPAGKDSTGDSSVLASLDFELKQPVSDLEYRFNVNKGVIVSLTSIELKCMQSNQN